MSVTVGVRALGCSLVAGLVLASGAWAADDSAPQVVPLAVDRVGATANEWIDIDGQDERVDVDVAVIDTGIDLDHPDLNIAGRVDCTAGQAPGYACTSASSDDGDDSHGHGTTSALGIAALDNGIGGVGVAAGARLWAVDVLDDATFGGSGTSMNLEAIISGIKWVTAHASEIEVAHMPLGCAPEQVGPTPQPFCRLDGSPTLSALEAELDSAIAASIAAGVVYIDGTGNWNQNVTTAIPHRLDDDLLLVSGIADSDGQPGGLGGQACGADDDHSWGSGWGALTDIASPGCATSAATTHVTAAAAILASKDNPDSVYDVREIVDDIKAMGTYAWTDDSPDGITEPLLNVYEPAVFDPKFVNRTMYMANSANAPCYSTCVDTGYEGELDFANWAGQFAGTCNVSFELNVELDGTFALDPISFTNCWGLPYAPSPEDCPTQFPALSVADQYGQLSWPTNVSALNVEIEAAICYRINANHYYNRLLLHPGVNGSGQRTWTQTGKAKTNGTSRIINTTITDTNTPDNTKLVLGTP